MSWLVRAINEAGEAGEPLYWSNADGWTEAAGADAFTDDEHARLRLPLGGQWERVRTSSGAAAESAFRADGEGEDV